MGYFAPLCSVVSSGQEPCREVAMRLQLSGSWEGGGVQPSSPRGGGGRRVSSAVGSSLIEARRPVIVSLSQEIEGWASDIQGKPFVSTMRTFGNVQDPSQLQAGGPGRPRSPG